MIRSPVPLFIRAEPPDEIPFMAYTVTDARPDINGNLVLDLEPRGAPGGRTTATLVGVPFRWELRGLVGQELSIELRSE